MCNFTSNISKGKSKKTVLGKKDWLLKRKTLSHITQVKELRISAHRKLLIFLFIVSIVALL
jgi:hypothetical protein